MVRQNSAERTLRTRLQSYLFSIFAAPPPILAIMRWNLELAHLLHHLLHLGKLVEHRVELGHRYAAAFRNALASFGIKQVSSDGGVGAYGPKRGTYFHVLTFPWTK